jgi:hypothetical protein
LNCLPRLGSNLNLPHLNLPSSCDYKGSSQVAPITKVSPAYPTFFFNCLYVYSYVFIFVFFFFFFFFIYSYVYALFGPSLPSSLCPPLPPTPFTSRQNLFCPLLPFC